jgi:AraC-like DNA-binding protein
MSKARAAVLTNYIQVAESVGLDADAMLARVGLSRAALANPDALIEGGLASRLVEESAQESGCMGFGLLMAESRPISGLGALALLFRHQRNLRDAIRVLIRYQHVLADTLVISLDEGPESAVIRTDILADHHMTRQPIELTVGEMRRAFTAIAGGEWHPECAHFVHAAPDDLSIHHRVLGCPVEFESEFNGLSCTSASLDLPIVGAEPDMARYAEDSLERLVRGRDGGSLVARVRRALYLLLPSGQGTLEGVGADLGLHPRALQRALVREEATFGGVLNDVRRELALRHLATPSLSIEAVAVLVGYATLSSFSRWFTAEFGVPANVWRAGGRR